MKKISFLITILYLIGFSNFTKAESDVSLKEYLEKKDIEEIVVAIHDGVRPLVSINIINNCFAEAEKNGNAIPVVEVVDSLRHYSKQEKTSKAVSRKCYKIVQTPQCFTSEVILKAYQQDFDKLFTDDATVVERLGETINLVDGNRDNIKITTTEDLIIAEAFIQQYLT